MQYNSTQSIFMDEEFQSHLGFVQWQFDLKLVPRK